jgi:DNA-binding NtrC family response regulator
MSGFDALDCLRKRCGHFPCVLITGHPTSEVYSGAAQRGIEHILFKPFPLSELSSVVLSLATPRAPAPGLQAGDGPAYAGEERRHAGNAEFPMRLFDGTWVEADRRHPAVVTRSRRRADN